MSTRNIVCVFDFYHYDFMEGTNLKTLNFIRQWLNLERLQAYSWLKLLKIIQFFNKCECLNYWPTYWCFLYKNNFHLQNTTHTKSVWKCHLYIKNIKKTKYDCMYENKFWWGNTVIWIPITKLCKLNIIISLNKAQLFSSLIFWKYHANIWN